MASGIRQKFALIPDPNGHESRRAMLDIRVIRENAPAIQERLKLRGGDHWKLVDAVLACDEKRRKAETEKQQLQNSRKTISKQIGMLKGKGEDTSAIEAEVRGINEQIVALDVVAEDAGLPAENRLRIQTVAAAEVQHRRRKIQRGERFRLDAAPERHRRRKPIATQEIRKIVFVFEDAQIVGHGVGLSHFNALTHHRRCTF